MQLKDIGLRVVSKKNCSLTLNMNRIIMSSDHVDSQGYMMTKEALEGGASQINGEKKLPWTMNHRRELPPIGRIINAAVEEKEGHFYLTAETEQYKHRKQIEWDNSLLMEYFDSPAPFISDYETELDTNVISLDPANFPSDTTFQQVTHSLFELNEEVKFEMHGRKSEIPVPEIVIGIGKLTVLYKLLKPFAEKFGEKFAEDVYEETKTQLKVFRSYVIRVVKLMRGKAVPKNRALNTVFEIAGKPRIELIAKTDNPQLIAKGLDEKRLNAVRDEVSKFSAHFEIVKIQFLLSDKGRWKFTYLTTKKGETIGKKECFKERDKQYRRLTLKSR
jgi:hypothetical protein